MKKRFLLSFLISAIVLMNACQKEHSQENGNDPSEGTLTDDGAGDCLPKTVNGAYVAGISLGAANYIEVQVNVTKAGNYTIYTDTVNGMFFRLTGVFSATGLTTVQLKGYGTPTAVGISNFVVNYGTSGCTIAVTTVASLGVFTLNGSPGGCTGAAVAGTYTAGTALNATNNVTINVNVTTAGAYSLTSTLSNGMTFTGSGVFLATGPQAIVLTGSGTPTSSGSTNIPLSVGTSNCSFNVSVGGAAGGATFTITCATAPVINGTYTVGTALTAANTVIITVDVATVGTYSITGTLNGMTFVSAPGATFAGTGPGQTVTLTSTGTPTTQGANTVSMTGGTAPCNVVINVNPAAGGAAVYTINCATAPVINGTYTVGTALTAANTVTITVDVATAGTYSITGTLNGMTFSSAPGASFAAAGAGQTVTLTASGTPTTQGANTVSMTGGTAPCNVVINVNPAAGGAAVFTINCAAAVINGTYTVGTALNATNTVTITVNVTTPGTYSITGTINGMTFSSAPGASFAAAGAGQTVTLTGTGTPTTAGTNAVQLTGGTAPCTFNVTVVAGGAVFTVNCASAVVNGTYTQNTALTGSNTITLNVNVTTAGTYNITTTATNGMTFTATGTWALGAQTLTLTGSGTPNASGTIYIPVTAGTTPCHFVVLVGAPAAFSDYFPRTTNSNWSFELDDVAADSSYTRVIAATHTALGNVYNVFMSNDGTGFDTSFYVRRAGNDYYHYVDLAGYLGLDNTQRVEFIFIKDNLPQSSTWTTPAFSNSAGGTPVMVRIQFIITQKDVPVAITSSTGTITYQNTIVIEEHYQADFGTGFISLDDAIGYFVDYYARNVGWIKDEYINELGAPDGQLELRRFVVY